MNGQMRRITEPKVFSIEEFRQPEAFYGPIYSWVWNAPLDEQTIYEQIDEMESAGIRSFYIIPEPPEFRPEMMITTMTPEYLSREFFEYIRKAVSYAEEKGMVVWVYDEGGWPSGMACGQVIKQAPNTIAKSLKVRELTLQPNTSYCMTDGTVAAFLGRERLYGGECFEELQSIAEYYREPINGIFTDLCEKGTTEIFCELTHKRYAETIQELGSESVPCFFTDEAVNFMPAFPSDFAECFEREYGYDITDYLYVLTDAKDLDERESMARLHYGTLIGKLLRERYFYPVREWCREHGLIFTGHLDRDHITESGITVGYGNPLEALRCLDMPGMDVILRHIYPDEVPVKEGNSFFVRMAPSAASQSGHLLSMSESYSVYGNELTPKELRWIANYQFVRGIQLMNVMLIPYGRDDWFGCGQRPFFCKEMPGFTHLRQWNLETARTSYFMSLGVPDTKCALYLPADELWQEETYAKAVAQAYHDLGERLEKEGIDFDIIDYVAIEEGEIVDGSLQIGYAKYHKIYVPEGVILSETVREKLSKLNQDITPFAASEQETFKIRSRTFGNSHMVMIFNQSTKQESGRITIQSDQMCYRADVVTGELEQITFGLENGITTVDVTLEMGEQLLLYIQDKPFDAHQESRYNCRITAVPKECEIASRLVCTKDGIWTDKTKTKLPYKEAFSDLAGTEFSGEITYRFSLSLQEQDLQASELKLVLERIEHSAEVIVNGRVAGVITTPPYELRLQPELLHIGDNTLEITVANTAANLYGKIDSSVWWDSAHTGPYHPIAQKFERERADGGLFGTVSVWTCN